MHLDLLVLWVRKDHLDPPDQLAMQVLLAHRVQMEILDLSAQQVSLDHKVRKAHLANLAAQDHLAIQALKDLQVLLDNRDQQAAKET